MSIGTTLVELHQFFEDDPDDYQLETDAEIRLKALYSCLVNATSRTTLQIGLTGLLTYVKASQRSAVIDELLLSKDYVSEIITIAADHFTTAPLLSASCLHECMVHYPKKFSPFLINKFRPLLPRIIYKKSSGPSEICCKCIAQLSVLGITSSSKQAKSWKNEYDRYLKIASLLIDQLYSGINDDLYANTTNFEAELTAEIGDVISPNDYVNVFSNCCHILRHLFYVQLDSPVTVACNQTFKLISKVLSINSQQFNTLHRKQRLPILLGSCIQLCDTLVAFDPSSFMFNIRTIFTLFISLLDLVRPQVGYLTLSINIYQVLTNFLALFHRQVRIDIDVLQKLVNWIINDTTIRIRSKMPVSYLSRPDHKLSRVAINCAQQLLNVYSDRMPKDQFNYIQNHVVQTILNCQTSNNIINKPYDDEACRVGLYSILECLLINERADCSTIIAISKDIIDNAPALDSSIKVKIAIRKLKLIWQQVHDSTSHLYQPWSFLNIDKPRKVPSIHTNSSMTTNELHNVYMPPPMPMANTIEPPQLTSMHTEPSMHVNPQAFSNPLVQQAKINIAAPNAFMPTSVSTPPFSTAHTLPTVPQPTVESFVPPVIEHHRQETIEEPEQQRKRAKLVDTRPVEIDNDEDDDGAEQIFGDESDEEEPDNEHIEEYDDEEIGEGSEDLDESDEVDEEMDDDDDGRSDISSEEDEERLLHEKSIKKLQRTAQSNVEQGAMDNPQADPYLENMNDNLHKKFRRQNHFDHYYQAPNASSSAAAAFIQNANNNYHQMYSSIQFNGDYKNNANKQPTNGNGQAASNKNNHDDTGDDDDIVLVSDDDSEDNKPQANIPSTSVAEPMTYMPNIPEAYVEATTTVITTTTTTKMYTAHDVVSTEYVPENIDNLVQPPCGDSSNRIEIPPVEDTAASFILAIKETIESLRDAVDLASDDYSMFNHDEHTC